MTRSIALHVDRLVITSDRRPSRPLASVLRVSGALVLTATLAVGPVRDAPARAALCAVDGVTYTATKWSGSRIVVNNGGSVTLCGKGGSDDITLGDCEMILRVPWASPRSQVRARR